MDFIHIKNLEEYNPGYKDRGLIWFKFYFKMVQGDPEFELIESEIDKWRYVSMVALELQSKKPLPKSDAYFRRKGFNLHKRSMSLTLKMLHRFIEYVTEDSKVCTLEKSREDKEKIKSKKKYGEYNHVLLKSEELKKLKVKFPNWEWHIKNLDEAIQQHGYKYKDHYLTILKWAEKETQAKKEIKGHLYQCPICQREYKYQVEASHNHPYECKVCDPTEREDKSLRKPILKYVKPIYK